MDQVPKIKAKSIKRERGEIHWHTKEEVEKAIEAVTKKVKRIFKNSQYTEELTIYWEVMIATLGYAGLQMAELRWLRPTDLQLNDDGNWELWVTTVDDDKGGVHELKTGERERIVQVHKDLLLPRLMRFREAGLSSESCLFPMPPGMRKRSREIHGGAPERWLKRALSGYLNGEKATTNKKGREGILPDEMTALSLRRTFGSLLLRSGKSVEEVAATMGNTPEVVKAHYARILGSEVDVDF